jgi:four helix bundle protein
MRTGGGQKAQGHSRRAPKTARRPLAKIESFRDLSAWQRSMILAEGVYRATAHLRTPDLYGLGNQIRRASCSIPANIAEGFSRRSRAAYRAHVAIALGSTAEVQTQLELLRRLKLVPSPELQPLDELASETGRLLTGLWRALGPVAVCYSWSLFISGCCSPGPLA